MLYIHIYMCVCTVATITKNRIKTTANYQPVLGELTIRRPVLWANSQYQFQSAVDYDILIKLKIFHFVHAYSNIHIGTIYGIR